MIRMKHFIYAAVRSGAGEVLAAECDGWLTEGFWEEADVAKVEACIAAGSKLNTRGEDGKTPLHLAAKRNENPVILDALIRHQ